jgi:hypothetical protein
MTTPLEKAGKLVDSQPRPVVWLVLQPNGIFGIFTDEDEAREIAKASGNLLTHVPVDADFRQR